MKIVFVYYKIVSNSKEQAILNYTVVKIVFVYYKIVSNSKEQAILN